MNRQTTHAKTLTMVQIAFLAAVEVILTLLVIPIGTINLNFGLVPIVIAGVLLGPRVGCLIGAVSGVVTMIQVLTGQSAFYVFLVANNPVMASLLCIVKTGAAGLISGLVYKFFANLNKDKEGYKARPLRFVGTIIASALTPIVNTGIFALGMLTIFGKALEASEFAQYAEGGGLIAIVFIVLIGINFFVELVSTVIITPPLNEAIVSSKLVKGAK